MRIFISSVRRGLEDERDALPGLIQALGHEPVRFEDFTAQSAPSREACLEGVTSSDVYLLLLGPHYGTRFAETGQSATHDEWVAAQSRGIPRYVFRKAGVDFDEEQLEFERALGDYGAGRFWKTFRGVAELQQQVAAVVRELERSGGPLEFLPLTEQIDVPWLTPERGGSVAGSRRPVLEIHVVPLGGVPISNRVLEQVLEGLPPRLRTAGLITATEAVHTAQGPDNVSVATAETGYGRFGESYAGSLAYVRVDRQGRLSAAFRLPGDTMGSILDSNDVAAHIAAVLRFAGMADRSGMARVAVAVGLSSGSMVSVGRAGQPGRSSASMGMNDSPVRVMPDEAMTAAALDAGAKEVGDLLSRALEREFGGGR